MAQARVELAFILYFAKIYTVLFTLMELGLFIYKVLSLTYSTSQIVIDVLLIACFFTIDLGRISVAQSGNKTALRGPVGVSIALTVATVFCSLYFYLWQTYVLHIDQTMITIYWALTGLGILMKFVALSGFA